jgi:hypothetical protein
MQHLQQCTIRSCQSIRKSFCSKSCTRRTNPAINSVIYSDIHRRMSVGVRTPIGLASGSAMYTWIMQITEGRRQMRVRTRLLYGRIVGHIKWGMQGNSAILTSRSITIIHFYNLEIKLVSGAHPPYVYCCCSGSATHPWAWMTLCRCTEGFCQAAPSRHSRSEGLGQRMGAYLAHAHACMYLKGR